MNEIIKKNLFSEKYYFQKTSNVEKLPAPDYVDNFVTDFSGWIYKCVTGKSSILAMKKGKEKERVINEVRIKEKEKAWANSLLNKSLNSDWRLLYNDLTGEDNAALQISDLKIRGSSLYGKPDLIFADDISSVACIIEIKNSNKMMPDGGWPNARSQLWAYSKIDILKRYSKIYLVCENYADDGDSAFANRIVVIDADDFHLNEENKRLFERYKSFEDEKPTRAEYGKIDLSRKPLPMLPPIE